MLTRGRRPAAILWADGRVGMKALQDVRMNDGSRWFVALPESLSWKRLRDHIAALPGAAVTGFLTDGIVEVWIDFTLEGEHFTINNQLGEFWFFVSNPGADEALLNRVVEHAAQILGTGQ